MPHIADRCKQFDSTVFQDIFRKQQSLHNPIDLSVGIPEDTTPTAIKLAGIEAIEKDLTSYTPTNGTINLRRAVAKKLRDDNNIDADEHNVTVVPGLTTGLLLIYMAILNPDDEIIVIDPAYPPYYALASLIGAKATRVLSYPDFQPNLDSIEASINEHTRAIAINSPNNPTGAVYPRETLEKIAEIAKRHNLYIISDEIYEAFVYEGEHFSMGSIYPNTITMNGFSKSHSMTGWRLGYINGPQETISAINQLQQYVVFSSSSIAQHAAITAMKDKFIANPSYIKKRDMVVERLESMGYEIQGGDGAYYIFFKVPAGVNDLEFVELAASHNLLLVPGRAFSKETHYVRLSYGTDLATLAKGLDILQTMTQELKHKKS